MTFGKICTVKSMQGVQIKVEGLLETHEPQDILLVFDVDMTLVQPSKTVFNMGGMKQYSNLLSPLFKTFNKKEEAIVLNLLASSIKPQLIEQNIPLVIQSLQKKKVPCMAFTAAMPGALGSIQNLAAHRFNALKTLGINFRSVSKISKRTLNQFETFLNGRPTFYKGILFSNDLVVAGKGAVFLAFLKTMAWFPKVVVLVDDRKNNLEDVSKALKEGYPKIQFLGIQYTGAKHCEYPKVNKENFLKQWHRLAEKARVLVKEIEGCGKNLV